jgi:hypothetical protein
MNQLCCTIEMRHKEKVIYIISLRFFSRIFFKVLAQALNQVYKYRESTGKKINC